MGKNFEPKKIRRSIWVKASKHGAVTHHGTWLFATVRTDPKKLETKTKPSVSCQCVLGAPCHPLTRHVSGVKGNLHRQAAAKHPVTMTISHSP